MPSQFDPFPAPVFSNLRNLTSGNSTKLDLSRITSHFNVCWSCNFDLVLRRNNYFETIRELNGGVGPARRPCLQFCIPQTEGATIRKVVLLNEQNAGSFKRDHSKRFNQRDVVFCNASSIHKTIPFTNFNRVDFGPRF